jgi:hypothetical protein
MIAEAQVMNARARLHEVGALLGGIVAQEESFSGGEIICELGPRLQLVGRVSTWPKPLRLSWYVRYVGPSGFATGGGPSTIYTAADRPAPAIVADLKRRLFPAAKTWCLETARDEACRVEKKRIREAREAELAQILGEPLHQRHNSAAHFPGLSIPEYHLENDGGHLGSYHAEITVHSWHCLRMIAQLVAADRALLPKNIADAEA